MNISEDEGVDTDDQPLMDDAQRRLQLLVVDNELEYNESMIVQREDEIREIEQGITELNEIFRDLGAMVHEQGSMLGVITDICLVSRVHLSRSPCLILKFVSYMLQL